jgi:predicted DNA-binding transcriptional regulator AlpA
MRKPRISQRERQRRARQSSAAIQREFSQHESQWVTGPTLRKMLGISAVTLWRWRRAGGFPVGKCINGRLYFPRYQVEAWLEAQPDAA